MRRDEKMDVRIGVSKEGYAGPVDVIASPTGRQQRSDAEKARIAAESLAPDAVVSASGPCFAGPHSLWSRPFAPLTRSRLVPLRSPASQLLWAGPTSPGRSSSAMASGLPNAVRAMTPTDSLEISLYPNRRILRMPGSTTTRGRRASRAIDARRVAF
jgi:transposase